MAVNAVSYVRGIIPDAANRERDDFYPTPPRATEAHGDGDVGGMIAFAWFVWHHGHQGPPTLGWL